MVVFFFDSKKKEFTVLLCGYDVVVIWGDKNNIYLFWREKK
jgi:hypothetical protein